MILPMTYELFKGFWHILQWFIALTMIMIFIKTHDILQIMCFLTMTNDYHYNVHIFSWPEANLEIQEHECTNTLFLKKENNGVVG